MSVVVGVVESVVLRVLLGVVVGLAVGDDVPLLVFDVLGEVVCVEDGVDVKDVVSVVVIVDVGDAV